MSAAQLPAAMSFVWRHPLSERSRFKRLWSFVSWQLGSRLVPGPVVVPFVNDCKLLVSPGMHGATGAVYTGLQEFHDMAFVLHYLRPDDTFVDVGANVGAYTVLAAGGVGCQVVALEPAARAHAQLSENVRFNRLEDRVEVVLSAAGAEDGWTRMTQDRGVMNRVTPGDDSKPADTPIARLDTLLEGRAPAVIKVDVEGFEPEVVDGAAATLANPRTAALLIETCPAAARDGDSRTNVDSILRSHGFAACVYDGVSRRLSVVDRPSASAHNTLYVRDPEQLGTRLQAAPRFRVLDRDV